MIEAITIPIPEIHMVKGDVVEITYKITMGDEDPFVARFASVHSVDPRIKMTPQDLQWPQYHDVYGPITPQVIEKFCSTCSVKIEDEAKHTDWHQFLNSLYDRAANAEVALMQLLSIDGLRLADLIGHEDGKADTD